MSEVVGTLIGLLSMATFNFSNNCPGTGVVALGQGNYDLIGGIAGLLAGSYFYAWLAP